MSAASHCTGVKTATSNAKMYVFIGGTPVDRE